MRGKRMTIFLGENDQWHHRPLYMAILEHLKTAGCAGATVTRGIEAAHLLHARHLKRLPVVDADGRVVGIVSRPALLAAALDLASAEPAR